MTKKERKLISLAIRGLLDDEPLDNDPYPEDYVGWEKAMEILCKLRDNIN